MHAHKKGLFLMMMMSIYSSVHDGMNNGLLMTPHVIIQPCSMRSSFGGGGTEFTKCSIMSKDN